MTTTQHTDAQILDPCSRSGFADIAAAYGIESAFTAKINALRSQIAHLHASDLTRHHDRRASRELFHAKFDFAWYLGGGEPARCKEFFITLSEGHDDPIRL